MCWTVLPSQLVTGTFEAGGRLFLEVPNCLGGEELLIVPHGVSMAARGDAGQVKSSFFAAVPALKAGK